MVATGGAQRWGRGDLPPQLASGDPEELWRDVTTQTVSGLVVRLERPQVSQPRRSRWTVLLFFMVLLIMAVAIVVYLYR
jgi:hypothetical protein